MKKISLQEAFEILEDASAIIINDSTLLYPSLEDLTGEPENEFMYLSWDDDGLEYYLKFCEGDNKEVEVVGTSMFLYDTDPDSNKNHTQITILGPIELENI